MDSATQVLHFTISGISGCDLLINNPRTVDPFDRYAKEKKAITGKRSKTEDDLYALRKLDVESKCYFASADPAHLDYTPNYQGLGIYVPDTWLTASIAGCSWTRAKIKKAEIRAAVFPSERRIKLRYLNEKRVDTVEDISNDNFFIETQLLKQGQVKIAKAGPIFKEWSFTSSLTFDPKIIDRATLIALLEYASQFGGYGDFRPTYGRAEFKEIKSKEHDKLKAEERKLVDATIAKVTGSVAA